MTAEISRKFRIIETGHRYCYKILVKSATRVEEFKDGHWVYYDSFPGVEDAKCLINNLQGKLWIDTPTN